MISPACGALFSPAQSASPTRNKLACSDGRTSVGRVLTGRDVDIIVIDDPLKPERDAEPTAPSLLLT
jgi:hypothetical protein